MNEKSWKKYRNYIGWIFELINKANFDLPFWKIARIRINSQFLPYKRHYQRLEIRVQCSVDIFPLGIEMIWYVIQNAIK